MFFPIIKNSTRGGRIFIFLFLMVFGFVFGTALSAVGSVFFGDTMSELGKLRFAQISGQISGFLIPPLFYAALVKEKPLDSLGFKKMPVWALLGIVAMFTVLPFNSLLTEWNEGFTLPESMAGIEELLRTTEELAERVMTQLVSVDTIGGLIINILMIGALAAVSEELLFRSVIQPFSIKVCKNAFAGIAVTAVLFSAVHFEFYGFIPRIVLGFMLGYMYHVSGSIWTSMLMHFVNNATIVVLYYLSFNDIVEMDVEKFGSSENAVVIIGSLVMTVAIFVACQRLMKCRTKK